MIRIKDIADRAGVSPTTVSNVIHGKTGRVSKATVEKINRILKEMEYVPSISARMLANNSSGLIGVALGFMKKGNASSFEDPFVSAMLGNLEYQIREHGYYMMLVARHEQDDLMQQALGWNFDGMIAMALKEKEIAELRQSQEQANKVLESNKKTIESLKKDLKQAKESLETAKTDNDMAITELTMIMAAIMEQNEKEDEEDV